MLKQYASDFYFLGQMLRRLRVLAAGGPVDEKEFRDLLGDFIPKFEQMLEQLDLPLSLKTLSRINKEFIDSSDMRDIVSSFDTLHGRIEDELDGRSLLYVSPERAQHYDRFGNGWEDAFKRFNIITDVEEAEKCFALGRYSACVFHLMRVVEIGVQEMGKRMKLPAWKIEEPWGKIVKAVHDAVLKMPYKTKAQKKKQQRWALVADALFQVNLAWRIPTEHPRVPGDVYTEEQASEALARAKSLMRHLADTIYQ